MNESVNKCRNRSHRELGVKRRFSGCVKVVVGWILVTHDGYGGLRSCEHRHGVGVKNGVKWGSEEDCYLKLGRGWTLRYNPLLLMTDATSSAPCALAVAAAGCVAQARTC